LQRIRRDAELEEERLRKEAEQAEQRERDAQTLANLKQQAEIQQLREKMESLELEKQILEKEMTLTESREKISRLQIELEKIRGEIKVELAEKEILAKSADVLQMRKIFMEALPKILAEANRPIEKMGEVRLLNISGIQDKTEQGGLLTGLLSSASLLPMIKDVIQFLGDLGNVGEQIQSTTQGEKGNHAPKNKSMNELVVSK
jgi:hypothetical protein